MAGERVTKPLRIDYGAPFHYQKEFGKYVILFPGAGAEFRRWPTEKFAKVADYISSNFGYKIIIAGASKEKHLGEEIISQSLNPKNILNYCGKTNLVGMVELLRESRLLISNDTSAVHMAASVGAKTIFFLAGNNPFGRFGPYPPRFKNMRALYPIELDISEQNYHILAKRYKTFPPMKIADIKPERVIELIKKICR